MLIILFQSLILKSNSYGIQRRICTINISRFDYNSQGGFIRIRTITLKYTQMTKHEYKMKVFNMNICFRKRTQLLLYFYIIGKEKLQLSQTMLCDPKELYIFNLCCHFFSLVENILLYLAKQLYFLGGAGDMYIKHCKFIDFQLGFLVMLFYDDIKRSLSAFW